MTKKIKILIVDNSAIVCRGLFAVITERCNLPVQIELYDENHTIQDAPRILIASPSFLNKRIKEIRALKQKTNLLIIGLIYTYIHPSVLSIYDDIIYLDDTPKDIGLSIHRVLTWSSSSLNTSANDSLTKREKEILKLLVSGNTTKGMAHTLNISAHTVNAHRKNIMRKLQIKTVSGLTVYAVLNNIIVLKQIE